MSDDLIAIDPEEELDDDVGNDVALDDDVDEAENVASFALLDEELDENSGFSY